MTMKNIVASFSYATSRNYLIWALVSAMIFIPLTIAVLLINATDYGIRAAAKYLQQRDFEISFSYATYLAAKATIAKSYHKNHGR